VAAFERTLKTASRIVSYLIVVIYFFNSDFKFFDDASEFSVTCFCVVLIFSSKFMFIFLQ